MPRPSLTPLVLACLAACAGPSASTLPGPQAKPGEPAPLAYRLPEPPSAAYLVGDTAQVDLEAAGQSFPLSLGAASRWRMEFAPAGERVLVTATLEDLAARISNPLTPAQTADESSVTGPVVFTMDERGNSTVVSLPTASGPAAAQFVSGAGIAYAFFPALPARPVRPGDSWTDTLQYADGGANGTKVLAVITYTVAGDTTVAGARYLLVRNRGTSEQATSGEISDIDFSQSVTGSTEGWFLWDPRAGMLHALEYRSDLRGTMMLEIVPAPMNVHVTSLLRIARQPRP